jgi:hypothetical protein
MLVDGLTGIILEKTEHKTCEIFYFCVDDGNQISLFRIQVSAYLGKKEGES